MKKQIVIGIAVLLMIVGLCGCTDLDLGEVTQFSITTFKVEPSLIEAGDTANLSWVVMSAQIVSIDNGIGNVSNIGNRIIMPTETTIYTLIAKNGTKTITATTEIIVKNNTDNTVLTVQMLADEDDDRLSVINTDADVYWDELAIRITGDVTIRINGEVTTSVGKTLSADTYYQVSNDMMGSGNAHVLVHGSDFIDLEGTSASLSDVTVTLIHDITDTTLGTYTYSSIGMKM